MANTKYPYLDFIKFPLDDKQSAVCCRTDNSVVAAGAGSGKTQVLATRFAFLVMEFDDIHAPNILTLTFTKKAASEMYDRIYANLKFFANNPKMDLFPRQKDNARRALTEFANVHIQTLDSYCGTIIKQAANRYGIRPDFTTGSADSISNIQNLALPYVIARRNSLCIQHYADAARLQNFTTDVFSKIIIDCTSLATEKGFFYKSLSYQVQEVFNAWNEIVTSNKEQSLNDCLHQINVLIGDKDVISKGHDKTGYKPWFSALENLYKDGCPVFDKVIYNPLTSIEENLSLLLDKRPEFDRFCELIKKVSFQGSYKLEAILSIKNYIKIIKGDKNIKNAYIPLMESIMAFCEEFTYAKELCEYLDEFLEIVNTNKRQTGALTFNDVTELALKVLLEQKDIRNQEKNAFKKIMIDEFQDNNGKNRDLLFLLSERPDEFLTVPDNNTDPDYLHKNLINKIVLDKLFFVGDEKQSIYKFRGAEVDVFNSLKDDLRKINGDDAFLSMNYNYRSTPVVLSSFNQLFGSHQCFPNGYETVSHKGIFDPAVDESYEAQYPYDAIAHKLVNEQKIYEPINESNISSHFSLLVKDETFKEKVDSLEYFKENEQHSVYIAEQIKALHVEKGVNYSDIAILDRSRTNRPTLIKWLEKNKIPYDLDAQACIFSDAIINDIYNFLRLCVYKTDSHAFASFLASPLAGLSPKAVEAVLCLSTVNEGYDSHVVPFNKESECKIMDVLNGTSDYHRYLGAKDFYFNFCKKAMVQCITNSIDDLWYKRGYRYETIINENVNLFEQHYDLLFELARICDSENKSLAWFVDQLAMQKELESSGLSEAPDMDTKGVHYPLETGDAVHIMTIHKSKGLQFKYVFIIGCLGGTKKDISKDFFYDSEFGVSLKPKSDTQNYFFLRQKELNNAKILAEFRRVFYVAVTRAINEYYIVGTYAVSKSSEESPSNEEKIVLNVAKDYYSDLENLSEDIFIKGSPFDIKYIKPRERSEFSEEDSLSLDNQRSDKILKSSVYYSKNTDVTIINKPVVIDKHLSPSDMESRENSNGKWKGEDKVIEELFNSIKEERKSYRYNDFGIFIHKIFELYLKDEDVDKYLREEFSDFKTSTFDKVHTVSRSILKDFSDTLLYKAAINARDNKRPFGTELKFKVVDHGNIVTGSIDLFYEKEDGTFSIIDYKTDHVIDINIYKEQQRLYRVAISKLYNIDEKKIKSMLYYIRSKRIEIL